MRLLKEETNPASSKLVIEKEEEYTDYINTHIGYVQKAYKELFIDHPYLSIPDYNAEEIYQTVKSLQNAIATHDASKFSDEEFYAYRERFYPTKLEQEEYDSNPSVMDEMNDNFEKAWQHHYLVNDHHPQHWQCVDGHFQENSEPRDMSLAAIIHMLCDWQAMSWQQGSENSVDWYVNHADKEKNAMSTHTKEIVEEFLKALYPDSKSELE